MARDRTLGLKLRAIDRMSAVIDRVQKRFPKLTRSIRRASRVTQIFNAQTKRLRASLQKIGRGLKRFGTALTIGVTLPVAALGVISVKAFANMEQGLRGIEKTTGLSRVAVGKLGKSFDQLSTIIPVSTTEMLELAKAGGQLGIKGVANIEKFTVILAKLSRASDVAGETGAKSIARILKVTGDGIGKVDRFSAALVDLGNNAAAGEQEILEVAIRVAGQIGRFDVASDKVLGIATALKALGKRAEAAGSVVGRAFDAIDQAIKKGGDSILVLSRITGIAVDKLKVQFEKDAATVFQKFVQGLSKVEKGGGNLVKVMGFLGIQGVRVNDVLGTLAKRPEVLAENLDRASRAFRENTALEKEFLIQTQSLKSELILVSNVFTSLTRLIGKDLAPVVKFFGIILKSIFNFLRNNPTIRTLVIVFGALAAILGPVLIAFGAFLIILPALTAGAVALGVALLPLTIKFIIIGAAIAAVIATSVILFKQWDNIKNFFSTNPFAEFVKFIFFVLTPIGQLITGIRLVIAAFSGLKAIKSVVKDILPSSINEKLFGNQLASSKGARERNRGIAPAARDTAVTGRIGITFKNAPPGTAIKAKTEGPLAFDLGFAGGVL